MTSSLLVLGQGAGTLSSRRAMKLKQRQRSRCELKKRKCIRQVTLLRFERNNVNKLRLYYVKYTEHVMLVEEEPRLLGGPEVLEGEVRGRSGRSGRGGARTQLTDVGHGSTIQHDEHRGRAQGAVASMGRPEYDVL